MTVLVVRARMEHLDLVRGMVAAAELPADGLEDQFPAGYVVALADGAFAGAAGVEIHGRDGLLRSLVVDPSRRGAGIGHALAFDRVRWAKRRELDSLWLLTTTAAPFFARLGFVETRREEAPEAVRASAEFSGACPDTATCMRLDLAALPTGPALVEWLMRRSQG
jgi:amino-acid N-acetyltransferase